MELHGAWFLLLFACGVKSDNCTNDDVCMLQGLSVVDGHQTPSVRYPSELFLCSNPGPKKYSGATVGLKQKRYQFIVTKIQKLYENSREKEELAACLLRFAGHDFMDFRQWLSTPATGGSDGCIDFHEPDNAGLLECLTTHRIVIAYRPVCRNVELADFLVIAAEAAMAVTSADPKSLTEKFMSKFVFGRQTSLTCPNDSRLMPDAEEGCYDLKRVFVDHIFLHKNPEESWKAVAAISGAHTLGSAKLSNSGYDGHWTEESGKFNNEYYKRILDRGWGPELNVGGDEKRNQWKIVDKSHAPTKQMMLNSDLCLLYDNGMDSVLCDEHLLDGSSFARAKPDEQLHRYVFCNKIRGRGRFLNAKERNCCAWTRPDKMWANPPDTWHKKTKNMWEPLAALYDKDKASNNHCGAEFTSPSSREFTANGNFKKTCCGKLGNVEDCDYRGNLEAPGWKWVNLFAVNETAWLDAYIDAWQVATGNSLLYTNKDVSTSERFNEMTRPDCGCCREDRLVDGDEGFEECEALAKENTRSKEFWAAKQPTWPLSRLDGSYEKKRESVVSKFSNYYKLANKWGAKWGSWFRKTR